MSEDNAVTIKFTGLERFKIIWLLLWTGEVRLWLKDDKQRAIWMEFLDRA